MGLRSQFFVCFGLFSLLHQPPRVALSQALPLPLVQVLALVCVSKITDPTLVTVESDVGELLIRCKLQFDAIMIFWLLYWSFSCRDPVVKRR